MLFRSLIRNSELRSKLLPLGKIKLKRCFICFSARLFVTLQLSMLSGLSVIPLARGGDGVGGYDEIDLLEKAFMDACFWLFEITTFRISYPRTKQK